MGLVLFNSQIGPYQGLLFWAREDLVAIAMKKYIAFTEALVSLEIHHQIVYCHNQDTHFGGLTPLQR